MFDKFKHINIPERPAFMQLVEAPTETLINNDYILQIDEENLSVNIIKLKKAGEKTMATRMVSQAKAGFEKYYDELLERKAGLVAKKEEALKAEIEKVTAEVDAKFAEEETTIDEMLKPITVEVEVEVEDEDEKPEDVTAETVETEVAEENVTVEAQPVNTAQIF